MKQPHLRQTVPALLCLVLLGGAARCVASAAQDPAASGGSASQKELAAALAVALDAADPEGTAILVASPALTKEARAAAASGKRRVIEPQDVPETEDATLPAGYMRLDSLTRAGDEAGVRLWKGPILKPKPGVLLMSCGTGLNFQLKRGSDGTWTITSRGISVC